MTLIKQLDNKPDLRHFKVHGKELPEWVTDKVYSADIELSSTEASQITLAIDDPGFKILRKGLFKIDTPVRYGKMHLYVATVETGEGGGLGGLAIQCRPLAVKKLKHLRKDKVYHGLTSGAYVKAECKAAGIGNDPVVEAGKKKKKIARDQKEGGTTYDPASTPSAWTTMQRLADENGFYLYEVAGTIYFGKPTWLVKYNPTIEVMWYPENGKEPITIPEFRQSIDSEDIEIDMELPIERAGRVFPGCRLRVTDFPRFSDDYFITGVSYPLVGLDRGNVIITASTIRNPEPISNSYSSYAGEWVDDADKVGINCKYTPEQMVERAYNWIGKGTEYARRCQAWVDVIAKGPPNRGAHDGIAEWAYKPAGTQHGTDINAPAGAVVCFSNPHTAISVGNGKMIGTTDGSRGVQKYGIAGWSGTYLGWKYPNLVGPP